MRRIVAAALVLGGCGGADYDLRATATMTVTPVSGAGTSPLEPLVGQVISFEVTFGPAQRGYDPDGGCPTTTYGQLDPHLQAIGPTAAIVQPQILDILPYWEALLSACTPSSGSSVQLRSDNQSGLGVAFGCHDLAPSLLGLDANGHPQWSTFVAATSCDATIYDQLNGRLYGAADLQLQFQAP